MNPKRKNFLRGCLFDRLVDQDPHETARGQTPKTLSHEELRASVQQEIHNLLNNRTNFPEEECPDPDSRIFHFGLPDFSKFYPGSAVSKNELCHEIQRAIQRFEPRLSKVRVSLDEKDQKESNEDPEQDSDFTLSLIIQAELLEESVSEPVTFQMVLATQ